MIINDVADAKAYFKRVLSDKKLVTPKIKKLCDLVLQDKRFWVAPAAAKGHHSFEGGLAVHTAQVLSGALSMAPCVPDFKIREVVVGAIWHDYQKIMDYEHEFTEDEVEYVRDGNSFAKSRHYSWVNHLAASAMVFRASGYDLAVSANLDPMLIEHIILSHHGRKEWGSPVEPKTPEAWAVHSADMLSSHYLG